MATSEVIVGESRSPFLYVDSFATPQPLGVMKSAFAMPNITGVKGNYHWSSYKLHVQKKRVLLEW